MDTMKRAATLLAIIAASAALATPATDRNYAIRITADLQSASAQSMPDLAFQQGATPLLSIDTQINGKSVSAVTNGSVFARFVMAPTATSSTFVMATNLPTAVTGNSYLIQLPTVGTNTAGNAAGWWYSVRLETGGHLYWSGDGRVDIAATTSTANGLVWQTVTCGDISVEAAARIAGDAAERAAMLASNTLARAATAAHAGLTETAHGGVWSSARSAASNTAARAAAAQAQATANAALTPAQAATLTVAEARRIVQADSNAWLAVTANAATLYHIVPSGSITTLVVSATSGVGYNGPPQGTLLGFVPSTWDSDYEWWVEPSWTNGAWVAFKAVNPPLGQPKGWGVYNEGEDHPEFWGIDASTYTLPATISGHDGAVGTLTLSVASVTAGVATNAYPLARSADLITHTNRTDNPHSVTAAQVGAWTAGQSSATSTADRVYSALVAAQQAGLTNAAHVALPDPHTQYLLAAGDTATGPIISTSASVTGPATAEFVTAGFVRGLMNNGVYLYNGTNVTTSGYSTPTYLYQAANPAVQFSRVYTGVTNNQYLGAVCTPAMVTNPAGPATVVIYMGLASTSGKSLTVRPELYFTLNKSDTIYEAQDVQAQTITTGINPYQWVLPFPDQITSYAVRRVKAVTAVGGPNLTIYGGGATPSTLSIASRGAAVADLAAHAATAATPTTLGHVKSARNQYMHATVPTAVWFSPEMLFGLIGVAGYGPTIRAKNGTSGSLYGRAPTPATTATKAVFRLVIKNEGNTPGKTFNVWCGTMDAVSGSSAGIGVNVASPVLAGAGLTTMYLTNAWAGISGISKPSVAFGIDTSSGVTNYVYLADWAVTWLGASDALPAWPY